jgi:dynein heavy chain 1, cytosolic
MYGGKIDDDGDMETLSRIVTTVVSPAAYELDHYLVPARGSDHGLKVPTGTTMPDFMTWVSKLPEREPPSYLGLPANAEKLLLVEQGQEMLKSVAKISEMLSEDEQALASDQQTI